jgi:hypothetical protein
VSIYRTKWLATTCPPEGARQGVQYLGAAVLTNWVSGGVIHCAGRFAFLPGGDGPVWLEPFVNDYTSEDETMNGFRHMLAEWDASIPYGR